MIYSDIVRTSQILFRLHMRVKCTYYSHEN